MNKISKHKKQSANVHCYFFYFIFKTSKLEYVRNSCKSWRNCAVKTKHPFINLLPSSKMFSL